MKGLLLKDFYMIEKYCRSFVLLLVVFLAFSCFGNGNTFLVIYPTLIAGLIPVTLISYDEREKWNIYSETLPYSRTQFVSAKYLVGLIFELAVFVLSAAAQAFRMNNAGAFLMTEYIPTVLTILVVGLLAPSFLLPFVFRFGAEKGRIAYYITVGALCAGGTILVGSGFKVSDAVNAEWLLPVIAVGAVILYALSLGISVLAYKKREL